MMKEEEKVVILDKQKEAISQIKNSLESPNAQDFSEFELQQVNKILADFINMGFKKELIEKILNESDKNIPGISKHEVIRQCFKKVSELSNQAELQSDDQNQYLVEDERSYIDQLAYPFFTDIKPVTRLPNQTPQKQWNNFNSQQKTQNHQLQSDIKLQSSNEQKTQYIGPKLNSKLLKISIQSFKNGQNFNNEQILDNEQNSIGEQNSISEQNSNNEQSKKEESNETPNIEQQCPICFSNVQLKIMSESVPCAHRFCQECNNGYLEDCIRNANVLRINCPMDGCKEELNEAVIKAIVNPRMWEKFTDFKRRRIISLNPNVRWCPKPNCEKYVVGGAFITQLQCECGQMICYDCGNALHQGQTCSEAIDIFYKQARVTYNIHPCPKCRSPIQKLSGCNHMTCYQCNHKFCWICFAEYSQSHYAVWNICGCIVPGGQFVKTNPWNNVLFWKILMAIPKIICFLTMLCLLVAFTPFLIIFEALKLCEFIFKLFPSRSYHSQQWGVIQQINRCSRIIQFVVLSILFLIVLPFAILITIFPLSCVNFFRILKRRR